ncbi:MAG: Fpg/Nei family DNA glycosylase, partial [Syntrophales bacterium]
RIEIIDALLGKPEELSGRQVEAVKRRGKFLQICLSGGLTAEIHLRMSGTLFWQQGGAPLLAQADGSNKREPLNGSGGITSIPPVPAYSRLRIIFPAGTLVLTDPRRFATFTVQSAENIPALVEDPLGGLSARRLREIARTRRLPVKSFLMDQRLIAGIGNIYACEILFAAGIDPRRPSASLTPTEWRKIVKTSIVILERAVACRGTTVSDWRDLFGCSGTNQDHLAVYARKGEACLRCSGRIERIVQSGRGTWFCPSCQH